MTSFGLFLLLLFPWELGRVGEAVAAFVALLLVLLPRYVSAERPHDGQANEQTVHFRFFFNLFLMLNPASCCLGSTNGATAF